MTNEQAISHIKDIICENNTVRHSDMVVFGEEKIALNMAIQALEQTQLADGDRAISLNAVLEIVNNPLNIRLEEIIKRLPSVTPQRPTGHWIDRWWEEGCEGDCVRWRCSECKELSCCNSNFYGDCGAKMD